jgi:hydrogenase nickel incorporation protein HypA/HybF
MHEYALVQGIVSRVEAEVRARGATRVHALRVSVGELSGVDPELLQTAYDTFRAGTVCAEAPLAITREPASYACPTCGRTFARGEVLRCERCGLPARLNERGDALLLESIDLEVP